VKKSLSKPFAVFELLRPANCLMAAFAAMLGYWLSAGAIVFPFGVFLAAAATFSICGAGQAINDYYDYEIDRKAKKTRPVPSGRVAPLEARNIAVSLFILGIVLASFVNQSALGVAVVFSVLLFVYSSRLSRLKHFGNAVVALATAFTFVMGATITGNYALVAILASASFFSAWARENAKDLEDFEADRGRKNTLPTFLGKRGARNAAATATIASIAIGILPLALGITDSPAFILLLAFANGVFLAAMFRTGSGKYRQAQRDYKLGMVFALAAFASLLF